MHMNFPFSSSYLYSLWDIEISRTENKDAMREKIKMKKYLSEMLT